MKFIKKLDYNKTVKNIGYLYILQILNHVFPILLLPLMIRYLGMHDYGILQFGFAFSTYVYLISDYGFSLSGPRKVALNKEKIDFVSETYYTIQLMKILIMSLCYILVFTLFQYTSFLDAYETISYYMFFYTLGQLLFPIWLFQGMEDLGWSSIITLVSKALNLVVLYIYFKFKNEVLDVAIIYGILNVTQALIAHIIAIKKYNIVFVFPSLNDIISELKSSWYLFISQSATSLFSSANVMILGMIATPQQVGLFATAEKIVRAAVNFVGPLSRAVYPTTCRKFLNSIDDGFKFVRLIAKYSIPIYLGGSILIYMLANYIAGIFSPNDIVEVGVLISIMAPLPILVLLNNLAGTQIMLNINSDKQVSIIIILTGIVNIVLAVILVPYFNAYGMAISSLISEVFIMLTMVVYVMRWRKQYENNRSHMYV